MDELKSAFNILKKESPFYEDRPQQMEMAEAAFDCLKDNSRLLVETGTGVGKSFAYLIPAILSNEKTLVSTASIALMQSIKLEANTSGTRLLNLHKKRLVRRSEEIRKGGRVWVYERL